MNRKKSQKLKSWENLYFVTLDLSYRLATVYKFNFVLDDRFFQQNEFCILSEIIIINLIYFSRLYL